MGKGITIFVAKNFFLRFLQCHFEIQICSYFEIQTQMLTSRYGRLYHLTDIHCKVLQKVWNKTTWNLNKIFLTTTKIFLHVTSECAESQMLGFHRRVITYKPRINTTNTKSHLKGYKAQKHCSIEKQLLMLWLVGSLYLSNRWLKVWRTIGECYLPN